MRLVPTFSALNSGPVLLLHHICVHNTYDMHPHQLFQGQNFMFIHNRLCKAAAPSCLVFSACYKPFPTNNIRTFRDEHPLSLLLYRTVSLCPDQIGACVTPDPRICHLFWISCLASYFGIICLVPRLTLHPLNLFCPP